VDRAVPDDVRDLMSDALLGPLLEAAADTLRALKPDDVPASLRALRGFDRRGLMHGPGPRQLRRALEDDADFRTRVVERFGSQSDAASLLAQWSPSDAWTVVEKATHRQELPLVASVLWAFVPPAADYGLGLIVAVDAGGRSDRAEDEAAASRSRDLAERTEALRRADAARRSAEADAERASEALRLERRARRAREEHSTQQAHAARRHAESVDAQLRLTRAAVEEERARTLREAQRTRSAEDELRRVRAQLAALTARVDQGESRLNARDARVLADAAAAAARVAAQLDSLRSRIETRDAPKSVRSGAERPLARRVVPPVPPGLVATSTAGVEAMLRAPGVVLVIDGYNVTKRAWREATPGEQRSRLETAVAQLQRRSGCRVVCVFDGDAVLQPAGWRDARRARSGEVRVVFSDAEEEADEVVVREVANLPKRVPVVVASSDAWVREHAEAAGAVVIPAESLLAVLRPAR
jgi:predicted RNA-binding protein with PIN domain